MSVQYPLAAFLHRKLRQEKKHYFANHNIYPALTTVADSEAFPHLKTEEDVKGALIGELEQAFSHVLFAQVIDTENDPNSQGTAQRLAKMYVNELFKGRYAPEPKVTGFPNEKPLAGVAAASTCSTPIGEPSRALYHFNNLLVVQSPFISQCSHHHARVDGIAYIGIIPGKKLIGLSKYTRLVRHLAARGTLQEELTIDIAEVIQRHTESADVGVVIFARHGCCEGRGIQVHNSQTSTAEMRGLFMKDGTLRKEFYDSIQMMRSENK